MRLRWLLVLVALLVAACGGGTSDTTPTAAASPYDLSGLSLDVHQAPD